MKLIKTSHKTTNNKNLNDKHIQLKNEHFGRINSIELNRLCNTRIPCEQKCVPNDCLVSLIASSHTCNVHPETKQVAKQIRVLLNSISYELLRNKKTAHFAFRVVLAGSSIEGTKSFLADEFDVVCEFLDIKSLDVGVSKNGIWINVTEQSSWSGAVDSKLRF